MGIKSHIPSWLKPVETPQSPDPIFDFKGPLFHKHHSEASPRGSVDATAHAEHLAAAQAAESRRRSSAAPDWSVALRTI